MMPTNYTAVKRPINQADLAQLTAGFNKLRGASAAIGVISLLLAVLTYLIGDLVLTILSLVFGLIAIGFGIQVAVMRRRAAASLEKGEVTEITGFPVTSVFAGRLPGWALGPITIADQRQALFQQGRQTTVACMPELGMVLSVDGRPLSQMTQMKGPKDIAPTQVHAPQQYQQPPAQPMQQPAYQQPQAPPIQPPYQQPMQHQPDYQPPPQRPLTVACPRCGTQHSLGTPVCATCGAALPQ